MKFFKTKAVAALSITLLLSTQTKPMGVDFHIDAGEEVKQTLTEQAKQVYQSASQKAVDMASSAYNAAQPYAVNAVGMAVNGAKSGYNTIAANPALSAGIAAGTIGAGVFAYKKPHVAGGIATAGIALGTAGLIAHDNPELIQAGKNAAINAGKTAANFATTNAPVVYNALTQNVVADYISKNPEIVIPAAIAGAAATYYGYAPAKRVVKAAGQKVAQAAKVVAPYAAKAAVVATPVAAAAAVVKYSPETVEAVKNAATIAGSAALDAGKYAANVVAENTPEFVKENPAASLIGAGAAGYAASQAYAPVKRGVTKAAHVAANAADKAAHVVAANAGKIAVAGAVAGTAALIAYDNQEAIVAGKDAAVAMAKDAVNAVANADYVHYGKQTVNAVKPVGAFVTKQASKLTVNGARMVNAARNFDYKKMAENADKYLKASKVVALATEHKVAIGATAAGTSAVVGAGYVADKYVLPNLLTMDERRQMAQLQDRIANASDIVEVTNPEAVIPANAVTQAVVSEAPATDTHKTVAVEFDAETGALVPAKKVVLTPKTLPAAAQPKQAKQVTFAEPVVEPIRREQTYAPVEVANPINNHPVRITQLTPKPVQEFAVTTPVLNVNVDSETSTLVQPKKVTLTPVSKPKSVAQSRELREQLIEKAINIIDMHVLTPHEKAEVELYLSQLLNGKGNLQAIDNKLNGTRRVATFKASAKAKEQSAITAQQQKPQ